MKNATTIAAVLASSMLISSCDTTGTGSTGPSKTQTGAGIGAVAGALLGASVSHDKTKGALLGGLLGGLAGAGIGKYLDTKDRERLAQSTQQTIVTGAPQTWTNPDTGVTAQTHVTQTVAQPEQHQIPVLKDKVQQVPPLDFIGEDYKATKATNVRGGPGTDYKVVGKLDAGATTRVVGKVTGQDWYLISENNVGSGFVAASLLQPTGVAASPAPPTEMQTPPTGEVAQATVSGTATCKVVTQQITMQNGQTESQDVKACRGPNGWEIVGA